MSMEQDEWIKLSAPLNKVGNSFSVRLPMTVVKELKAEEGSLLVFKIKKLSLVLTPEILDLWFRTARKCKELDKFSDEKIILLCRLAHNEGKYLMDKLDMKFKEDRKAALKASGALKEYRGNIKKEFGTKLFDEYLQFREITQPIFEKMNKS